jgi:hypothetical protein
VVAMAQEEQELNLERQEEELSVLQSIYGDEILSSTQKHGLRRLELRVSSDALLRITLTDQYPSSKGPLFDIVGRNVPEELRIGIERRLKAVHAEDGGEVVLYDCIEICKDFFSAPLADIVADVSGVPAADVPWQRNAVDMINDSFMDYSSPGEFSDGVKCMPFSIYHGEPITDRKSTFQAHVCSVSNKRDVELALKQLLSDKKIQRAHHPCMYAFRITQHIPLESTVGEGSVILLADNNDDGEAGAGSKLANLLEILHADNVLVMVTRWYGGIHLGPDRFKHIANSARLALVEGGHIDRVEGTGSGGSSKKGKKHGGSK